MKEIFKEALNWYEQAKPKEAMRHRTPQLENLIDSIGGFEFDKVVCIETGASKDFITDGAVGVFFAKVCELSGGEFHSVDIEESTVRKSMEMYAGLGLEGGNHYVGDSVEFLKQTDVVPNLVHLDSWDVNLKDPLPCALHGWREFEAIEGKMPKGSVLIVDDNWFKGTWVEWITNGQSEKITIDYPILGKGALVWHYVNQGSSNWVKINEDQVGANVKIIYKKI